MNPLTSLILWASVQVLLFSLVGVLAFLLAPGVGPVPQSPVQRSCWQSRFRLCW